MKIFTIAFALLLAAPLCAQAPCGATEQNPCWIGTKPRHTLRRWPEIAVDVLWAGSAATDVALSQSCIQATTCYEGNHLMASSAPGASVMETAETFSSMYLFHRFKP